MKKTILLTGATDGIGFEAARRLAGAGHTLLVHGRSATKLAETREALAGIDGAGAIQPYRADLSVLSEVEALASAIARDHRTLDVLINNAGVYVAPDPIGEDGYDIRFMVNTVAPYVLTKRLLPLLPADGRVINLSSATQAPVDLEALANGKPLNHIEAYAQSKLAITMWSIHLARKLNGKGPSVIAVNPASRLGTKMVREAYGVEGRDKGIGADILVRAALSDEFANASGRYFDNDQGSFGTPHPDTLDALKNEQLVKAIETLLIAKETKPC